MFHFLELGPRSLSKHLKSSKSVDNRPLNIQDSYTSFLTFKGELTQDKKNTPQQMSKLDHIWAAEWMKHPLCFGIFFLLSMRSLSYAPWKSHNCEGNLQQLSSWKKSSVLLRVLGLNKVLHVPCVALPIQSWEVTTCGVLCEGLAPVCLSSDSMSHDWLFVH